MALYRGMDRAALDAAYNNGAAVGIPKREAYIADWSKRSAAFLAKANAKLDMRYGDTPRQTLDFFAAAKRGGPTLMFIHGGYWQGGDKEIYRFLAEGPIGRGINVAFIEYTLAPAIRMDGIVAEIARGVDWLVAHLGEFGAATNGIVVSGHSAGGHLTATTLGRPGVLAALPISGLFDLEPIRLCYLNDKLALDEAEAKRNSPILHLPARKPPMVVAVGGGELPELIRQSKDYAEASGARYLPLAGHDHFSILEEMARPDGKLLAALTDHLL